MVERRPSKPTMRVRSPLPALSPSSLCAETTPSSALGEAQTAGSVAQWQSKELITPGLQVRVLSDPLSTSLLRPPNRWHTSNRRTGTARLTPSSPQAMRVVSASGPARFLIAKRSVCGHRVSSGTPITKWAVCGHRVSVVYAIMPSSAVAPGGLKCPLSNQPGSPSLTENTHDARSSNVQ